MYRYTLRIIFITVILLIVSSCGSSRKTGITGSYPASSQDASRGMTQVPEWTDLRVPVTVSITSPSSLKVSGIMTMINGKDVHISLRMLGFEVGAAYITGDSLFAYAKLQRVYVAESITGLLGGVDATVTDVQSLLIGAPVTLPALSGGTTLDMTVSDTTGQPLSITVSHQSGRKASAVYTPFDGLPFASSVAINATTAKKQLSATLSYDWSKAQADTGISRSFSIPSGYRRINATALIGSMNL